MSSSSILQPLKALVLILIIGLGVDFALAWTGPSSAPPTGNVSAPVNVGSTNQVKSGGLGVANFVADSVTVGATANASAVTSPKYCIGTSCITMWWSSSSNTDPICLGGSCASTWGEAVGLGDATYQVSCDEGYYSGNSGGTAVLCCKVNKTTGATQCEKSQNGNAWGSMYDPFEAGGSGSYELSCGVASSNGNNVYSCCRTNRTTDSTQCKTSQNGNAWGSIPDPS